MSYPLYFDEKFDKKIKSKKEIYENRIIENQEKTRIIENYQYLASNFINPKSPYSSILLYMQTGTGKTFTSVSIAENFIRNDSSTKVIVITKSKTLIESFLSDIINVYSRYASPQEIEEIKNGSLKTKTIVKTRIKKHYSFVTYVALRTKPMDFSNKIIIVDEVHNLIGNSGYTSLYKNLKSSKNSRLVLLSATPVYDKITGIFEISNLLNYKKEPIDTTDLFKKYNTPGTMLKNSLFKLTTKGVELLKEKMKGKVIYMKSDISSFPSVVYPRSVKTLGRFEFSINVVPCMMKGIQKEFYEGQVSDFSFGALERVLESISSVVYPDKSIGQEGMEKYITGRTKNTEFLKEDKVENYSTKLYQILKNIKNSKGKVYIHSSGISDDGVPLIRAFLLKNGYSNIISITSDTPEEKIQSSITKYNSPDNDNGEKIKILVGSNIISEGVTLKSVRQVHIYEPGWNYSSIDQIKGRAIRKGSHSRLPKSERNVQVYLYCAFSSNSNIEKSIDVSRYLLSTIKDKEIKKLERVLAKSAFSCSLLKKRNIINGQDDSRECEYEECNYRCDDESDLVIDLSTYDIYLHNREAYDSYVEKILPLLTKHKTISIYDLSKITKISKSDIIDVVKRTKQLEKFGEVVSLKKSSATKLAIIPSKKADNVRAFINEKGVFSLEKERKMRACTTGFTKQELVNIATSLNILPDGKSTKKSLCDSIQKFYNLS